MRGPWPRHDQLDPAQRAVRAAITGTRVGPGVVDDHDRLRGPFNAMLLSPTVGDALQALGVAIRFRSTLPAAVREVAVLLVAASEANDYEWATHEPLARDLGVADGEIERLRYSEVPATFVPSMATAARTTLALLDDGGLDDAAYEEAEGVLGSGGVAELVILVGYYRLLALLMRTFAVPG